MPDFNSWPVVKQIATGDVTGLNGAAYSPRTEQLQARTKNADKVAASVCPYCGVGCGQLIYVKDNKIINIEGDPRSPISEGCLCPKGAATFQLVTGTYRQNYCLYRKPYGTTWERIPYDVALDMVAERVKKTREETWEHKSKQKNLEVNRTLGIAHLGGATLDNEENYVMKKLYTALGVVQVENQARI